MFERFDYWMSFGAIFVLKRGIKMFKTNCPNCGAPLCLGKCQYCGTETIGEIQFDEYVELNLTGSDKYGNKYILPICGRISNITMTPEYIDAVDSLGNVVKSFCTKKSIDFSFSGEIREN